MAPATEEEEALSRTEFTDRIENFFEYDPLKAGKPSNASYTVRAPLGG